MHRFFLVLLLQFAVLVAAHAAPKVMDRLTILNNTDIPGGDYESTKDRTHQGCRDSCIKDKRCKAYTYNHQAKTCFLKKRIAKSMTFKGATSGVKFTHSVLTTPSKTTPDTGPDNAPDTGPNTGADTGPDTGPPIKAIIDTWARATALCIADRERKPETLAWCEVSKTLRVVLELRNWCRGKEGQGDAEKVWHECEATSLRIKVPEWVLSR